MPRPRSPKLTVPWRLRGANGPCTGSPGTRRPTADHREEGGEMGSLTIARESRCATCWSLGPEESLLPDPLLRSSWLEAKCIGQTPPLANSKIPPPIGSHPGGRGSQGTSPSAGQSLGLGKSGTCSRTLNLGAMTGSLSGSCPPRGSQRHPRVVPTNWILGAALRSVSPHALRRGSISVCVSQVWSLLLTTTAPTQSLRSPL